MTPEERAHRSLTGRLGAHVKWANTRDRSAATAAARKALEDSWERKADPEGLLSPAERREAAQHLKTAHYLRMSLAAKKARARRRKAA